MRGRGTQRHGTLAGSSIRPRTARWPPYGGSMAKNAEDARRCERCQYQWYAARAKKTAKPRWFDETGANLWTNSQTRMIRLQSNYDRAKTDYDRWTICANCGSSKVATVSHRNFNPTRSQANHNPAVEGAYPSLRPEATRSTVGPHNESTANVVPLSESASPGPTSNTNGWMKRYWRILVAGFLFAAPLGSIGDETTYTGPVALDILKFVGILMSCGLIGTLLVRAHIKGKRNEPPASLS
jgi:hypothetical protein